MGLIAGLDVQVDVGLIISSLAPSILIVVTYYYSRRRTVENHQRNTNKLNSIEASVNGPLVEAVEKIDAVHEKLDDVELGKRE